MVDGSPRRLMLTSWRTLLAAMSSRAGIDGDSAAERDILQLEALCEREDSEAFLPLRGEEFAPAFARRMLDMRRLVDDATTQAGTCGFVNVDGLKVTPQAYGYGRYLRIGGIYGAWLGVHYELWARQIETPLWLVFYERAAMLAQKRLGGQNYGFTLPVGVEYGAVLDSVVGELEKLADTLSG